MPQQLLDDAQIAAAAQEMGGEAVAKRMRRGVLWQSHKLPKTPHHILHDARMERASTRSAKHRVTGKGTDHQIILEGFSDVWQHRHHALLVALAHDHQLTALSGHRVGALERKSLGEAQSAPIE